MTPEALKLLAVVLARDGGFFDIKANVAARTELGVSGYLRMNSRQAVPSDDHTDGPHRSGAWQQGEAGRVTARASAAAGSCTWPYAAARSFTREVATRKASTPPRVRYRTYAPRRLERSEPQIEQHSGRPRPRNRRTPVLEAYWAP